MQPNIELFNYSKENPEDLFDPFYEKGVLVITKEPSEKNSLMTNNENLIELITSFNTIHTKYKKDFNDEIIQKIIDDIINILDNTPSINFSAFVQFFMVQNSTYTIYKSLNSIQKKSFIYEMLKKYCSERHEIYSKHGYSNIVLQVMSDNYSHKRNSKTGIDKVLNMLNTTTHPFSHLQTLEGFETQDNYYFLPDKGDKYIFENILNKLNIKMESRNIEQNKLPDIVFKHNNHYYICELKSMKEGGGGQNKQIVEIAYFIKFSEKTPNIHYITFLDCNYSNIIFNDNSPKILSQRNDIINALKENSNNYFLNTKGLLKFIENIFTS